MGLTASVLWPLHPREGDGALAAALAEAQQEGAGLLVLEQRPLALLADEAHDAPGGRARHSVSHDLHLH